MTALKGLVAPPPPVRTDPDGVARVASTRVSLESVLTAFKNGSAPEAILLKYPSLDLTDIYAVIAYYLWNRAEVEAYLEQRRRAEEESRKEVETRFPNDGMRERLLSRRPPQT